MKQQLFFSGSERVIMGAGRFLAILIVARALGAEGQGVYAFYLTVSTLAAAAAGLGIETANTYLMAQPDLRTRHSALIGNTVGFSLVSSTLVAVVAVAVRHLVPSLDVLQAIPDLALVGVVILNSLYFTIGGLVHGLLDFRNHFLGATAQQVLYLGAIAVLAVLFRLTLDQVLLTWIIGLAVATGYWLFVALRSTGFAISISRDHLREQLSYGSGAYAYRLGHALLLRADVIAVAVLLDSTTLGIYSVARAAIELLLYIPNTFSPVLLANASQRGQLPARAFAVLFTVLAGSAIAIAVLGPFLLPFVLGSEFSDSLTPLHILLPGAVALGMGTSGIFYVLGRGEKRSPAFVGMSAGLSAVVLSFALAAPLEMVGAALASSVVYTALAFVVFRRITAQDGVPTSHYFWLQRRQAPAALDHSGGPTAGLG